MQGIVYMGVFKFKRGPDIAGYQFIDWGALVPFHQEQLGDLFGHSRCFIFQFHSALYCT